MQAELIAFEELFQSLTGVPGHLATYTGFSGGGIIRLVSIPNGRPRPFSQCGPRGPGKKSGRFNP